MKRENFYERARNVHGYKYNYINIPEKILLTDYIEIDLDSNIYKQRVSRHLLGKCPEKNIPTKNQTDFITESIEIWGEDKFDYSLVNYKNANTKVILINKQTGIQFEQTPSLHLKKHQTNKITNEDFINESNMIYDFKYSHSRCKYINKTNEVILSCPEHGIFKVMPYNHLNYNSGCKKCLDVMFSKIITKYLNKKGISFYINHHFDDLNLPFNIYIPYIRTCIIFKSEQFTKSVFDLGKHEYNLIHGNIKRKIEYCEEFYIDLIIIKYDQITN